MGPVELAGLPAHILLVHVVVVVVPAAALGVVVAAWWPRARRWLGWSVPLLSLVALGLVPLTTHAGAWLRARVAPTPLVAHHAALGEQMLPWAGALAAAALACWLWNHDRLRSRLPYRRTVSLLLAVVSTVVAIGIVVQVYRVGESGSRAVWQGNFRSSTP